MSGGTTARGFFGKIPARGDFVRYGLPAPFVRPWDSWASAAMTAAQARMGPSFRAAWEQAPAWRFVMTGGLCGPTATAGVCLPGTDRAGRLFPLVLAVLGDDAAMLIQAENGWLTMAEQAGRAALAFDEEPEFLVAGISASSSASTSAAPPIAGASVWWTEGGPRVVPRVFTHATLPPTDGFAGMLDDGFAIRDEEPPE